MEVRREDESALLRRLVGFSRALHSAAHTESLIRLILEEAPVVVPLDRMSLVLRDEDAGVLRVAGVRDGDKIVLGHAGAALTSPFASMEVQVVNYGAPLFIDDALGGGNPRRGEEAPIRSIMVAPLKYAFATISSTKRTEAFGVVAVGSLRANRYLETEKAIYKEVIGVISTALGVMLDRRRERRRADALATANAILFKLQGRSNMAEMLRIVAADLGQALGASRARGLLHMVEDPDSPVSS
jgi:GAF domain-containing protein